MIELTTHSMEIIKFVRYDHNQFQGRLGHSLYITEVTVKNMRASQMSRQDIDYCFQAMFPCSDITGKNQIVDICKICNIIYSIMDVVRSFLKAGFKS